MTQSGLWTPSMWTRHPGTRFVCWRAYISFWHSSNLQFFASLFHYDICGILKKDALFDTTGSPPSPLVHTLKEGKVGFSKQILLGTWEKMRRPGPFSLCQNVRLSPIGWSKHFLSSLKIGSVSFKRLSEWLPELRQCWTYFIVVFLISHSIIHPLVFSSDCFLTICWLTVLGLFCFFHIQFIDNKQTLQNS